MNGVPWDKGHIFTETIHLTLWRSWDRASWYVSVVKSKRYTIFFEFIEYHSTCFGRSFRPSSGVQECSYSVRHMSYRLDDCLLAGSQLTCMTDTCCCVYSLELLMMDGKDRPKHVEWYSKLETKCASFWFYYRNSHRRLLLTSRIRGISYWNSCYGILTWTSFYTSADDWPVYINYMFIFKVTFRLLRQFGAIFKLCFYNFHRKYKFHFFLTHGSVYHDSMLIKVQLDATVCRHLFTATSLYMFRVSRTHHQEY